MILTTSQLIAQVESGDLPGALRFEPGFKKYLTGKSITRCIQAHKPAYMNGTTASTLLCFSYGRYQIMGENIYALGYSGTLIDFICSDALQLEFFNKYVESRKIDYSLQRIIADKSARENFARRYNGSVLYAETMMQHIRENAK